MAQGFLGRAFEIIRDRVTEPDGGSDRARVRPSFRPALAKTTVDLRGLTELRVHGVGGTPPESLLGEPKAQLVAGDQIAGFYRGSDRKSGGISRHVEAYSWGGLTSRSSSRVWWLLLLPFALVNVAGWMQAERKAGGLVARLIRGLALSLTATYVLWISVLSVDMIAYQCGGDSGCYSGRWWLSPLENDWLSQHAGHRLALGALVPLAFILVLTYLGRRSRRRYEEQLVLGTSDASTEVGLEHPDFWRRSALVKRLGLLHFAAALATLALIVAYAMLELPRIPEGTRDLAGILVTVAFAELGAFLIATLAIGDPFDERAVKGRRVMLITAVVSSALTLILALGVASFTAPAQLNLPDVPGRLPGMRSGTLRLFTAQQVLALIIGVALLLQHFRQRKAGKLPPFYWPGPFVAATLAFLILDAVFSGAAIRFADFLGAGVPAGDSMPGPSETPIVYAVNYLWFAIGFTSVMMLFLLVTLFTAIRVWREQKREEPIDGIDEEYKKKADTSDAEYDSDVNVDPAYENQKRAWLERIWMWRFISRFADRLDVLLTSLAAAAVVCVVAAAALRTLSPDIWNDPPRGPVVTALTWVLGLLPLAFVLGVRRGEKNPELRRKIGILWDVLTVWPRHYHPFAPPCYAERAIPDLQKRIARLTQDGRVILSGHSQGAVLAVMTMLQLPLKLRRSVALVTHGSPVTRLYRKFFPAWFGGGVIKRLGYSLGDRPFTDKPPRWQNFYRKTDPIGGVTFLDPDAPEVEPKATPLFNDESLLDPAGRFSPEGDPWPPVAGHSHYLVDPVMVDRVDLVAQRLEQVGF